MSGQEPTIGADVVFAALRTDDKNVHLTVR